MLTSWQTQEEKEILILNEQRTIKLTKGTQAKEARNTEVGLRYGTE